MGKVIKTVCIILSITIFLGNAVIIALPKAPTLIIGCKNAVSGGTGTVTVTVKDVEKIIGGYSFEIKLPDIVQVKNVYLNGNKLASLSSGGSDYNVREGNKLVLVGLCNYSDENNLYENTIIHIEFTTPSNAQNGEYPVKFTENTFFVPYNDDEKFIYPTTVNGKINITTDRVYKADINESGKSDAYDVTLLIDWLLGADVVYPFNMIAADVNEDGKININDLVSIKRFLSRPVSVPSKSLPDTGGTVDKVSGGAEDEANALRKTISEAKDTLTVTGKKYYVSQNGNDSNAGTSPDKPFKTLQRIAQLDTKLSSGDGVFLERGSVFRTASAFVLKNGVTYGAYGTGKKPEIWGSEKNYANKSLWSKTATNNVWKMSFPYGDAGIIVLNGGSETGKKQKYQNELTQNDDFYHDWNSNTIYFYCDKGNPGEVFDDMEIGAKQRIFQLNTNANNIKVDNICFKYSGIFGIRGDGNVKNITITNCEYSFIGGCLFDDKSNRYGNGIEFSSGCDNVTVKNCFFNQIFDSGVTFQVGNVPFKNFTVEGCLFEYNGMSGFEWWTDGDNGYKDDVPIDTTQVENIAIKNNIIRFTGYGWSKAVRSPAHIRGGWRNKWYPNLSNFVISNNIFDCTNGQIIASAWISPPDGYILRDNIYYQNFVRTDNSNGMFLPFTKINGKSEYVTNYEEFVWAVGANDKSPKKIVWLDN